MTSWAHADESEDLQWTALAAGDATQQDDRKDRQAQVHPDKAERE
jgi:hypothetical protein